MEKMNHEEYERKENVCCICGKTFTGWGNNPWPIKPDDDGVCCDECNKKVIEERILLLYK